MSAPWPDTGPRTDFARNYNGNGMAGPILQPPRKKDLTISSDDKVPHSFYGLQIGDKKSDTLKKLHPAFKLMYELKAIGNEYFLTDVVYPDYYLTLMFDENDRLFMMIYQENKKYELQ